MSIYGPFFFTETNVTGVAYLDILQQWLMPQLHEDNLVFICKQMGQRPIVCHFLNNEVRRRWIGRGFDDDNHILPWPLRSPDLTSDDFFHGVALKIVCSCPICHVIYSIYAEGSQKYSLQFIVTC